MRAEQLQGQIIYFSFTFFRYNTRQQNGIPHATSVSNELRKKADKGCDGFDFLINHFPNSAAQIGILREWPTIA